MGGYLKNKKGEDLYTMVITETNNGEPNVFIRTWKECKEFINKFNNKDDDSYKIKIIEKEINEEHHRAHLYMLCNHKGWGGDFYKNIYVAHAISFD